MKKFASTLICVLLVALMVVSTVASAESDPTGTLKLYKYTTDESNKGTQPNSNQKPVPGAVFTAYKVASITGGLFELEEAFEDVAGLAALFEADGGLTYKDTTALEGFIPALQQKIAAIEKAIADAAAAEEDYEGPTLTSKTSNTTGANGLATIDTLALGIYVVIETTIPAGYAETSAPFLVQLPWWNQDATATAGAWEYEVTCYPKNDPVTLTKKIVENNVEKDLAAMGVGDVVTYKLTVDIPYYGALEDEQIEKLTYTITDTMDKGLTFNDNVTITVLNGDEVDDDNYSVTFEPVDNDATEITISFTDFDAHELATTYANQGGKLVITYTATINENAVIGAPGNTNTAQLEFTSNPRKSTGDGTPDPDTTTTEEDSTTVYTYGMDLTKKFNGKTTTGTPNASAVEFTLGNLQFVKIGDYYYVVGADWKAKSYTDTDGKLKVALPIDAESDDQTVYEVVSTLNPSATGKLIVKGLDEGTYTLTETKTVNGYSKLESDITIVVTGATTGTNLNGKVTATAMGKALSTDENGTFLLEINNVSEQFNLPQTGGAGLLAFTIGGGIVIAGAIIIFSLLRKKKSAK